MKWPRPLSNIHKWPAKKQEQISLMQMPRCIGLSTLVATADVMTFYYLQQGNAISHIHSCVGITQKDVDAVGKHTNWLTSDGNLDHNPGPGWKFIDHCHAEFWTANCFGFCSTGLLYFSRLYFRLDSVPHRSSRVSGWVGFNVPINTLQVISEKSLSSQSLVLVLTT